MYFIQSKPKKKKKIRGSETTTFKNREGKKKVKSTPLKTKLAVREVSTQKKKKKKS